MAVPDMRHSAGGTAVGSSSRPRPNAGKVKQRSRVVTNEKDEMKHGERTRPEPE
jgi:hypothetical protein